MTILAHAVKQYNSWIRPIMARFQNRQAEHDDVRDDFTEWMKNRGSEEWSRDYEKQAELQILLAMAAIHTTTNTTTLTLHKLLDFPECIEILREEAKSVVAETAGKFDKDTAGKLKKMDSFIRETGRHNGFSLTTFKRYTLKDIIFSDGTFIPAHTHIEGERFLHFYLTSCLTSHVSFDV